MRLWLAIQVFFQILFSGETARRVRSALSGPAAETNAAEAKPAAPQTKTAPPAAPSKPKPVRSEALTLLATLQREARLIDFLHEKLDG
jgi:hypothetical protein